MSKNIISFKSKFGWLSIIEYNGYIREIKFTKSKGNNINKILKKTRININKFFLKKSKNIKIPFKIIGNKIQKKVWEEIREIKFGKTKTYGDIAKKLKISPRYVGKICGENKLLFIIPCHRVIRSDGKLGGFSAKGGIKLKKKLLEFEKI